MKEDKMDEYDKKFAEMQKYIPFLEAMIERLQKVKDKSREAQLQKMQSLHGILSNSKRKLRIETLQRCEDVLQKLHNKVEKGNTAGLNTSNKKSRENSSQSTSSKETATTESSAKPSMEIMDNETPASPSPTASPDHMPKSTPIIIPMERSDEANLDCDSKPASPDQCEHIPVTEPIIIPTERKDDSKNEPSSINHNSNNCGSDSNDLFSEWDMLEESENQMNKSRRTMWQSGNPPQTEVAASTKSVGNHFSQKVIPESRSHIPMATRHIPAAPAPTLGGLRRIMSVFDKNRLGGVNASSTHSEARPESPVNVSEVRLKSPDPDMIFPRLKITSPRQKDGVLLPKLSPKPSTPLLVSPPSVLTEPPLSIEDLAELLSDETDGNKKDKPNKVSSSVNEEQSKTTKEACGVTVSKSNKETLPSKNQHKSHKDSNESKVPNSFLLTQEDIDRESERRWEEIDKHIVKLTARRCLPNKHTNSSLNVRLDCSKAGDNKFALSPPRISQPLLSPGLLGVDKSADHRNRPPSPLQNIIKERENEKEHRYADNYERHPRQYRDSLDSGDDTKDKSTGPGSLSRLTDEQLANIAYHNLQNHADIGNKSDDCSRNGPLYQRRGQTNPPTDPSPPLNRSDYFARNPTPQGKRTLLPSPGGPDFPNAQWGSGPSYSGNIRPPPVPAPNSYQRNANNANFHQDMWPMASPVCPSVDFHQMNETESRMPQFNPHPPVRPIMNSVPRQQDINRGMNPESGFREETGGPIPIPVIQPMISPPAFPPGTQYRNPRLENRPYDASYDRPSDISQARHTWDSASTRVSDVGYRRDGDSSRGRSSTEGPICRPGTPAPYARPGTPAPLWSRERERNEKEWNRRGRGRERYYNDRGRSESRTPFNRDSRKSEWEKDGHNERDNRPKLNRDNKVSERDPRVRPEQQSPQSPALPKETTTQTTVRDPRLNKDAGNAVDKPKEVVVTSTSDRDPRKRTCETKGMRKTSPTGIPAKVKEKPKTQKSIDQKNRRDSELDDPPRDKGGKDKLHSSVESLYGVIDTKAKTGQGYGLQKFKIPKIKRPDPPRPPTPPIKNETIMSEIRIPETSSFTPDQLPETSYQNERDESEQSISKIDEEIGSTVDATATSPGNTSSSEPANDVIQETENNVSSTSKVLLPSAESILQEVATSTEALPRESGEQTSQGELSKESDASKPKEEVTKEWIEALIRKSFEFGEGKQLFDQAKLLHKLGEALHAKKLKKIQKIIESDSESSSSSKEEEVIEPRKTQGKKKRRVIFSDSSEEESLANRLGLLKDSTDEQNANDEVSKEEIEKKVQGIVETETPNENFDSSETVSKIEIDKELEISIENEEETHDTNATVEEVALPAAKKKRAYKKRGKSMKKVESNAEDQPLDESAESKEFKDVQETKETKETEKKIPQKIKNKRRNSLEMLQEDIREMFISEGVVTATGHRMCRLIKEGNSNLNSTVQNLSSSPSEKNSSKSDCKRSNLTNSDSDDTNLDEPSKKTRSTSLARGRARGAKGAQTEDTKGSSMRMQKRTSKRVSRVISRQYVDSSESEDDEPLMKSSTLSESLKSLSDSEAMIITEQSKTLQKSESPQSPETQRSEDSATVMFLRRSKRVPRVVVEKTESSKLDSSKTMFDSSSDESFGIDVSELAAAVDISLHPESQSHPDTETAKSPKATKRRTRNQTTTRNRNNSRKNKSAKSLDDLADDAMYLTDEGSMLSDISMSSSITSIRKNARNSSSRNSIKCQQDTNEELLSDILIGLTAKSGPEKPTEEIGKESDVDADEELDEAVSEMLEGTKKNVTKRKKKKFNWQMGILSKRKRKKKVSTLASSTILATRSQSTEPSDSLNKTGVEDNDSTVENSSFNSLNDSENSNLSKKNHGSEEKNDPSKFDFKWQECIDVNVVVPAKSKSSSRKSGRKIISHDETNAANENRYNKSGMNYETFDITQDDTTADSKPSEIEALLEYAWTGQERYKCMLCAFTGKNIVHHYKCNHPNDEVLISRLVRADAKLAIEEANNTNMKNTAAKSWDGDNFNYNCRFCLFGANGTRETTREAFYEHCTTHTGEYRYKCVSCPYQTVAKSSVKSHYYKVCRKFSENVSVAIIEDSIPNDDIIHGYICSVCNFVQLKECNIKNHLHSKHGNNPDAKYIKINMSLNINKGSNINADDFVAVENSSALDKGQKIIPKKLGDSDEVIEIIEDDSKEIETDNVTNKEGPVTETAGLRTEDVPGTNTIESSEQVSKAEKTVDNAAISEASTSEAKMETDRTPAKTCFPSQSESEALPVNGNLSVFVCPPEVAIKEHEIQLERKKKMQEIVENIGIKVNRDGTKQPLSIIDKLKVKMDTTSRMDSEQNIIETDADNVATDSLGKSLPSPSAVSLKLETEKNPVNGETPESNTDGKSSNEASPQPTASVNLLSNCPEAANSEDNMNTNTSNLETKIKDPLSTFDETFQNFASDTETSDTEMMSTFEPYESDSSNDQSENQISQDVNSLLKETTTDNNAPVKGLMHRTIQRLAAQLKKGLTPGSDGQIKNEKSDGKIIPKAPHVIPLASIKQLWNKQEPKSEEIGSEHAEIKSEQADNNSPPKNLIRIRRLSGDKLSIPSNPFDVQEENQLSSTEGSASDLGTGVLQTDTEEECSFLRIENVVSLAPTADDAGGESSIISDIRKAVETSPAKPKISILKTSPIILHKVGNRSVLNQRIMNSMNNVGEPVKIIPLKSLPSTSQTPKPVLANIAPKQPSPKIQLGTSLKKPLFVPTIIKKGTPSTPTVASANVTAQIPAPGSINAPGKTNFKIIKLARTATLLKHKESVAQSVAMKLKAAESYKTMLKPAKLLHLFKCMARECSYTTNSLELFKNHYEEHIALDIKEKQKRPFGCQNCAYCCAVLDDWNLMEKHLLNRHSHCRYQCSYCFYRAVTQSYVELHQATSHPGHVIMVLEGKAMGENIPDDCIDRNDIVKPFICQQECGKSFYIPETFVNHLKTKHGPLLSMFKCHLCPATCLKPEKLVSHYKMHGIYKYQCMYCLNGSDMTWELHNHLSNFHCNLPPFVIERTLLPQASINQDVINQLVMKNVEDDFKYTDLVTNIEDLPEEDWQLGKNSTSDDSLKITEMSSRNSPTETFYIDKDKSGKISLLKRNLYSRFCDSNTVDGSVTGSAAAHFTIKHSKDDESLTNRISIPEIDDFDDYSLHLNIDTLPDKLTENRIAKDPLNNGSSSRVTFGYTATTDTDKNQAVGSSQRLDERPNLGDTLFVVNSPVDPLRILEKADCNSNNDGQESNETLKKSVKDEQCNPLSLTRDMNNHASYDDSDIEILEDDIAIVKKPSEKGAKTVPEVDAHNPEILQSDPLKSDKMEETRASVAENNGDDTNANTESTANTETSLEPVQPLTLDDIKHTGFTGTELYKCGNDDCSFSSETVEPLKAHLTSCTAFNEGNSLSCAHCRKRFVKVGFLLEHLKTHSVKRFGCSLCKMRCTLPHQAMSHMKSKHKYSSNKLVPADPKNPSTDGLFVVQPIRGATEKSRGKKRTPTKSADKDSEKCVDVERLSFNPDEIDTLPRQAIYNREAFCAVCPYSTKVRTNMVRHLQLHAQDQTVPESGPVNPVPCLDKKERMFDKMVNLASSSHQNGRMGGKNRETGKENTDDASVPQFVPEHKRYVCGVAECNYLTVDDTMLRCHLKALHSDELYFRCPHCPLPQPGQEVQNIGIDKMGIHLKMHDNRLYKCSHCNHHHYHRHVVERHLADKHAEKRPFVKVIREPETTEPTQTVQDAVEDEGTDRDGTHWTCNLCDYKSMYKNEMISHASTEHDERSQFKCTECTYKTSGKINFEQHFVSRHPAEPQIKYDMVYQKMKGALKKAGDSTDQGINDEPFDTTPLWRRDMPRVRHIRGILLEEDEAAAANGSSTKGTKRKSDGGDISNRPAKSRPKSTASMLLKMNDDKSKIITPRTPDSKKAADPNSPANERLSKTRAVDRLRSLDKSENEKINESSEYTAFDTSYLEEFSELSDSEMGQFGPYGRPNGNMYVCTLCNFFETRYKHDLRDHLYRELKYKKWHCRACGFLSVNKHTLVKHFSRQHPGEHPDHEMLTPDNSIEEWVTTLLQRQTNIIKGISNKPSPKVNLDKTVTSGTVQGSPQSKKSAKENNSIVQSALKTTEDNSKTVDLTHAISNLKHSSIDMDLDVDDEGSRDNDDLVIDLKDENTEENDTQHEKTVLDKPPEKKKVEKRLVCKHCHMKFARWRGFKLHVQVTHLKRLSFLCPYCDRSANSEVTMRQHVRAKHPGSLEKVIHNPAAGGPELSPEFWEREYGLVPTNKKRSRKRKHKTSIDEPNISKDDTDKVGTQDVCNICGFNALNLNGLKAHMRIHANKPTMKCSYCTFSGSIDAEVRQHWRINHPQFPFKFEDLSGASPVSQIPPARRQKKKSVEEYNDDIEEEQIPSATDSAGKLNYCCFYCSLHCGSIETLRVHWQRVHRESRGPNELGKWTTGLPFRYKKVNTPLSSPRSPQKMLQCGYCQKIAGKSTLRVHMRRKHSGLPPLFLKVPDPVQIGWVCQWCNEFCETEAKMKHHQNMFHSHLPSHFKKLGSEETQKGYCCPECPFTSMSTVLMKKHVAKHVNLFKCKYCETTFTTPNLVATHSAQVHPGLELKIESISNYDSLVEKLMSKALWSNPPTFVKTETLTVEETPPVSPSKKNAVAKKSTAKRIFPSPKNIRCVARKSTNPLSRYPPGLQFRSDEKFSDIDSQGFTYYGLPSAPISLDNLSTYMSVGGHQMKVSCTALGRIMNINPKVLVEDLKRNVKSSAMFSNRT